MTATLLAYVENDNILELDRLRDIDDDYINDATVTCTSIAPAAGGDDILGTPLTLAYVAASSGRYRGTVQDTLDLEADTEYVATVTVTGGGLQAKFYMPFTARQRTTR